MKLKYIIIAIAIVLCGGMSSCEDFLAEDAKGTLTPETFFQNEAEANLALNALQGAMTDPGMNAHDGTDCGVIGRDVIPGGWVAAVYMHDPSTNSIANNWSGQYSRIRDVNLLLGRLDGSPLTDEVKASTRAQALFYRAIFYFNLTTDFGDVPYWRDEVNMEEVAPLGKTAANTIQEDMITDLAEAISSGALSTSKWGETGRPTVWAARMLKAHFHIWLEQWPEARAELVEITENSPHTTLSPYGEMYKEGNELHDELIFGRQYLIGVQHAGGIQNAFHPNRNGENTDARVVMGNNGIYFRTAIFTVRKSFADTYDLADARRPYNVWNEDALADGTPVSFNFTYMPKNMGAALPASDPLWPETRAANDVQMPRRLFKLADALLLLAETEFMIGGSSEASLAPINRVRVRAELPELTELTIEDIRQERGWELLAEGFFGRKKDLIRWGILESTLAALPAAELAAGAYTLAQTRAEDEAAAIAAAPVGKYRFFPIPVDEILVSQDIGGALVQNPLWE